MNRREFLRFASAGCLFSLADSVGSGWASVGRQRLNVLFLQMDQHHHSIMGCAGNPVVKTPNLDRLAREGIRFTNAVCATPYCSPTRAALITGKWPHTTGIINNCKAGAPAITSDEETVEGMLFDRGYATEHIGKWHLGDKSDLDCYKKSLSIRQRSAAQKDMLKAKGFKPAPPRDGEKFIQKAGVYATVHNYRAWRNFHNTPEGQTKGQDLMAIGREAIPAKWEFWGQLADESISWLKANRDRNFMLTYSASPPHALWIAPDPWYSMYDPTEVPVPSTLNSVMPKAYERSGPATKGRHLGEKGFREMIRCYYAQVTMIDHYIGRILDALDETGLAKSTLVIYLSDHGDMQGAQGGMLGKSLPAFYDQIVRVPLIMRLPGVIPAGRTIDVHANSVDIAPTIMEFLNIPIPESIQGRSLKPVIKGHRPTETSYGFCERPGGRMARSKKLKYCFHYGGKGIREELFDLVKNPEETANVADDPEYADSKVAMRGILARHMDRTGDPILAQLQAAI